MSAICEELTDLVSTLQETAKDIILLTLPPIPKLERKYGLKHLFQLEVFNQHIRSMHDG